MCRCGEEFLGRQRKTYVEKLNNQIHNPNVTRYHKQGPAPTTHTLKQPQYHQLLPANCTLHRCLSPIFSTLFSGVSRSKPILAKVIIQSLHLVLSLPWFLYLLGCHSYFGCPSVLHMTLPIQVRFLSLIVITSLNFVCSLVHASPCYMQHLSLHFTMQTKNEYQHRHMDGLIINS